MKSPISLKCRSFDQISGEWHKFRASAFDRLTRKEDQSESTLQWLEVMAYGWMKRLRNALIDHYAPGEPPRGALAQAFADIVTIAEHFVDPECPDDGYEVELAWVREIRDRGWDRGKLDVYN